MVPTVVAEKNSRAIQADGGSGSQRGGSFLPFRYIAFRGSQINCMNF